MATQPAMVRLSRVKLGKAPVDRLASALLTAKQPNRNTSPIARLCWPSFSSRPNSNRFNRARYAKQSSRFGVRGELSGKGEEMVGNFLIGPVFGHFAAAKLFKMSGDGGRGTNGI